MCELIIFKRENNVIKFTNISIMNMYLKIQYGVDFRISVRNWETPNHYSLWSPLNDLQLKDLSLFCIFRFNDHPSFSLLENCVFIKCFLLSSRCNQTCYSQENIPPLKQKSQISWNSTISLFIALLLYRTDHLAKISISQQCLQCLLLNGALDDLNDSMDGKTDIWQKNYISIIHFYLFIAISSILIIQN